MTHNKSISAGDRDRPPPIGHNSAMVIEQVDISTLKLNEQGIRRYKKSDEKHAANVVRRSGVQVPLGIDGNNIVRVGELLFIGAKGAGLERVPVVRIEHLTAAELDALQIGYARIGELGSTDQQALARMVAKLEVEIPHFEVSHLGFEVATVDIAMATPTSDDDDTVDPLEEKATSVLGDLWLLGKHRLLCGSATEAASLETLMGGQKASMTFNDPPFGGKIDGFFSPSGRHREFVMGSGDMSQEELAGFFVCFIETFLPHLINGAVVYLVIDWRSLHLLLDAAAPQLGPLINLAVWTKDRRGLGSFLRSQHELVLIFKAGKGRFRNNVQLGAFGRDRSNVWSYPSAKTASKGSDEGDMLAHHPTPKPVRMVADAILDTTKRGDIVLDVFLGSGTTLIAAEKVGRRCFGLDLDPLYVDLTVRRWQGWTGEQAIHAETGRSFAEIAAERLPTR